MNEDPSQTLEAPPQEVSELASTCLRYVELSIKFRMDYSIDSLAVLDHYVQNASEKLRGGQRDSRENIVTAAAIPIGAYLGEVARRILPVRWHAPQGEHQRWRLEGTHLMFSWNPLGAAIEALTLDDSEGWGAHFRLAPTAQDKVHRVLAQAPEMDVEEFYSLTNRIETLMRVFEILSEEHLSREESLPPLEDTVYSAWRAEAIGDMLGIAASPGGSA